MNKRTRITKNSLESIGGNCIGNWWLFEITELIDVCINLKGEVNIDINGEANAELDVAFEYLEEFTTLLEGLTGKKQFYKKIIPT